MKNTDKPLKPATLCVHAGAYRDEATGAITTPIFTASSYAYPNPADQNFYQRYFNTPNQRAVAAKLAALEQGEDALVFGSGMAAITTVLFALLKPGDHAVFQEDLYGGSYHFVASELTRFGVEVAFARSQGDFTALLRPNTRLIYVESPSNPLLRCVDLAAVAALAKARGLLTVIDNTVATPINQNPLALGISVVVHSATKYLNGHSDLNAGAVIASREIITRIRPFAVNHGGMLDAHACYMLERGLKTLALRIERQNANAGKLAGWLQKHPAIARVNYPGLPEHPDHAVAARQMRGFGGMLSFELRDAAQAGALLGRFKLATAALSLGGVETLVTSPAKTSHVKMTAEERARVGIRDALLRVSVGIEDGDDIINDFQQALEAQS
ncbi:MAG: PLP-dependent transferase [Verrucomicrobia bacterium]|nr:PLP-dependent transferase [Verrucomicrobiota bacterium]